MKILLLKTCSKCDLEKDLSSYHRDKSKKDGLHPVCKECHTKRWLEHKLKPGVLDRSRAKSKEWREANPARNSASIRCATLRKKYGISSAQYEKLFDEQGRVCAICKGVESKGYGRMHVDHNHSTGKVRGILCQACNVTLGKMQDSPELLRAAANYLENNN